jgi:ABC-type lipoprotein export system ATPase subunit
MSALVKSVRNSLDTALELPSGARFYRCALQVNPYAYLVRYCKPTTYSNESSYNAAIIEVCKAEKIEVIAVTDHYRIADSIQLIKDAEAAGLIAFPGFEATTKEGVHFLCLFNPRTDIANIERKIGDCGIHDATQISQNGNHDASALLEHCKQWKALCVAAHVAASSGLLKILKGQARTAVWKNENLLACSLPGSIVNAPDDLRPILENKNPEYKRTNRIAILNAQDISDPQDLSKPASSCFIKMSEVSVQGLRQAFLDPESRIRLQSDSVPDQHAEFVAISWQGSFLNGVALHFNENLNVLIGGRGAGKSTVIESLRYVLNLQPLGDDARKVHESIVRHVVKSGTKISLLLRSYRPEKHDYVIERTAPNPPIVRDKYGTVLPIQPLDLVPRVEVYGQHEVAELAKSREKLTLLLHRFMETDEGENGRASETARLLERSRVQINLICTELTRIKERLSNAPVVEQTLKRYQESGLEERLKEQSIIAREERVLRTVVQRVQPFKELQLHSLLPIDRAFVSDAALRDLPGAPILRKLDVLLATFQGNCERVANDLGNAIQQFEVDLASISTEWNQRKKNTQASYEKILRELQKSNIDGEEFLRLQRQMQEFQPLREQLSLLEKRLREEEQQRRNLLAEWQDLKQEQFQRLERAAKKVTRRLRDRVRVTVRFEGNREPLLNFLRDKVGGRLSETLETLNTQSDFSLADFVDSCRHGREELVNKFLLPLAQADRLVQVDASVLMELEEVQLPPVTEIELNVASEGETANWKLLDNLSTGQKATAVLLLLLLESDAPLVVDQPEDDLDNHFVTESVVPKMREEKRRRQFIFATHNANIPVLGDAELIVGLSPTGEASASVKREHLGSLDSKPMRELVEELLEGGREAFEMRRLKYGF